MTKNDQISEVDKVSYEKIILAVIMGLVPYKSIIFRFLRILLVRNVFLIYN